MGEVRPRSETSFVELQGLQSATGAPAVEGPAREEALRRMVQCLCVCECSECECLCVSVCEGLFVSEWLCVSVSVCVSVCLCVCECECLFVCERRGECECECDTVLACRCKSNPTENFLSGAKLLVQHPSGAIHPLVSDTALFSNQKTVAKHVAKTMRLCAEQYQAHPNLPGTFDYSKEVARNPQVPCYFFS